MTGPTRPAAKLGGPRAADNDRLRVAIAHRRSRRERDERSFGRRLCASGADCFHRDGQRADGGGEQRPPQFSSGDRGLGHDRLFRPVDSGERRDVSGLGYVDHSDPGQHWRHGALNRRFVDDHGAMTWRRPTEKVRMETGFTALRPRLTSLEI